LPERAAYYAANPDASPRNPFDQFSLLVNGNSVDWNSQPLSIDVGRYRFKWGDESHVTVCVETAFHLSESAQDTELDIDVRLISERLFYRSGWQYGNNAAQTYMTIPMPDGRVMHKALNSIRLSKGDPDKVRFDLYPFSNDESVGLHDVTLRLISNGLRRDLVLNLNVLPKVHSAPPS
jgi:hypothetical protein